MASISDKPEVFAICAWGEANPNPNVIAGIDPAHDPGVLVPYGGLAPTAPDPFLNPAPDPEILGTMTQINCTVRKPENTVGLYVITVRRGMHVLEGAPSVAIFDDSDNQLRYSIVLCPKASSDQRINYRVYRVQFTDNDNTPIEPNLGFSFTLFRATVIPNPVLFPELEE